MDEFKETGLNNIIDLSSNCISHKLCNERPERKILSTLHLFDVYSVLSFDSFRALNVSNSESFIALELTLFESFREIRFQGSKTLNF